MSDSSHQSGQNSALAREVGLPGAVMMGLGSILGSGVFVSIAVALEGAGPAVVLAVLLAAAVATANALSSAQLAAAHPVSGGTYEYGYRLLSPLFGFSAGWMFLCAKCFSAATAALGFAGYLSVALSLDERWAIPLALAAVGALTLLVAGGIKRSNAVNAVIVLLTISSLVAFCAAGLLHAAAGAGEQYDHFFAQTGEGGSLARLLEATALMFVAYTGYGRIATLGEEVREPERTIPKAIITTLWTSALLYLLVAVSLVGSGLQFENPLERAAPLELAASAFGVPGIAALVAAGAITAMLGVLLNLLLGLSRVLLAMSRRGDMPAGLAAVARTGSPRRAVVAIGAIVAALTLLGDVKTTWTFSAFTVLIYYAITNLAALKLPPAKRRYRRGYAWCGLIACLFLAFWVEQQVWIIGLGLLAAGAVWHAMAKKRLSQDTTG